MQKSADFVSQFSGKERLFVIDDLVIFVFKYNRNDKIIISWIFSSLVWFIRTFILAFVFYSIGLILMWYGRILSLDPHGLLESKVILDMIKLSI